MSEFRASCPHCGTRAVGFKLITSKRVRPNIKPRWDSLAICGYCTRGILATFETSSTESPDNLMKSGRSKEVVLKSISPSPPNTLAPEDTPSRAASYFRQGMENLRNNHDAAVSMFRSALEAGLKQKFPDINGSLFERIERAAAQNGLTPELAEWAHQIRLGGNDAVHGDEEFSKEDVERLQAFTELVFMYLFTLPGMLAKARDESEEGEWVEEL